MRNWRATYQKGASAVLVAIVRQICATGYSYCGPRYAIISTHATNHQNSPSTSMNVYHQFSCIVQACMSDTISSGSPSCNVLRSRMGSKRGGAGRRRNRGGHQPHSHGTRGPPENDHAGATFPLAWKNAAVCGPGWPGSSCALELHMPASLQFAAQCLG